MSRRMADEGRVFSTEDPERGRQVWRLRDGVFQAAQDMLVVEEPLEIRVNDRRFAITMRTPGDDLDLARGLLLGEGVIGSEADIGSIRYCDTGEDQGNIVTVHLRHEPPQGRRWQRTLMAGTSCGLCGKAAIEAVSQAIADAHVSPLAGEDARMLVATVLSLPDRLRERQAVFGRTGGLHAAGIFDTTGECRAVAEDIGRHNATDRVIGQGVREGWLPWDAERGPLALLVSGRASFEITQKAFMARIPIVCSVSAASALAVAFAETTGQTLIGFLRGSNMTIYTGLDRLRDTAP